MDRFAPGPLLRRHSGTLIQSAKAAVAAVAAWLIAAELLRLPQPFLAPYAAVFLMEPTVYRSFTTAVRQVAAVAAGVLLAAAVGTVVPVQSAAIGVAVLIGLVLGSWRRMGDSGIWIGVTALLLLSYGTTGNELLLVDRLIESALGAAIGLAVNVVILPPAYVREPARAVQRLARELSDLLTDLSRAMDADEPPEEKENWSRRARDAEARVRAAEDAIGWASESVVANPRRIALRERPAPARAQEVLASLRAAWPHIRQLCEAVEAVLTGHEPFAQPSRANREAVASLLDALGRAVTACAERDHAALREAHHDTETALDRLHRGIADVPDERAGLGAVILPARTVLAQLSC
ncbi:FUSC family protein [Amycolatopsis suaedae]|uniref:Integral membrane bound transporter domain-containing protein n=1 Tax=Amycolatopsis suaedae TaxID=2510978 RepID=A0A4Q7IYY8_9PSEU|nr:FUSC family protein [Amycolatopsis suaedae]RZQ60220.1 hypothetical protein EWH70_29985 [Amycolatopsis suaedae]